MRRANRASPRRPMPRPRNSSMRCLLMPCFLQGSRGMRSIATTWMGPDTGCSERPASDAVRFPRRLSVCCRRARVGRGTAAGASGNAPMSSCVIVSASARRPAHTRRAALAALVCCCALNREAFPQTPEPQPTPATLEPACTLQAGPLRSVVRVLDAETVLLDDNEEVRLIGALAPRSPDANPGAQAWPPEEE